MKRTDEFLPRVDSSVPLIHHDLSDLRSNIRIRIFPKKRTHSIGTTTSSHTEIISGIINIFLPVNQVSLLTDLTI